MDESVARDYDDQEKRGGQRQGYAQKAATRVGAFETEISGRRGERIDQVRREAVAFS